MSETRVELQDAVAALKLPLDFARHGEDSKVRKAKVSLYTQGRGSIPSFTSYHWGRYRRDVDGTDGVVIYVMVRPNSVSGNIQGMFGGDADICRAWCDRAFTSGAVAVLDLEDVTATLPRIRVRGTVFSAGFDPAHVISVVDHHPDMVRHGAIMLCIKLDAAFVLAELQQVLSPGEDAVLQALLSCRDLADKVAWRDPDTGSAFRHGVKLLHGLLLVNKADTVAIPNQQPLEPQA